MWSGILKKYCRRRKNAKIDLKKKILLRKCFQQAEQLPASLYTVSCNSQSPVRVSLAPNTEAENTLWLHSQKVSVVSTSFSAGKEKKAKLYALWLLFAFPIPRLSVSHKTTWARMWPFLCIFNTLCRDFDTPPSTVCRRYNHTLTLLPVWRVEGVIRRWVILMAAALQLNPTIWACGGQIYLHPRWLSRGHQGHFNGCWHLLGCGG